jgi:catechol 2,3-dioxygenase-like lactoylglutathione lyase family enzyme
MTPQFDCVFYYVSDLERAVAFYENALGLKLESNDLVARFELNGVCLELVPTKHAERYCGTGNARLCLRVGNMNAARNDLMRLGVMSSEPVDEGAGLLSSIHDLDGNEICLWEERKAGPQPSASLWAD